MSAFEVSNKTMQKVIWGIKTVCRESFHSPEKLGISDIYDYKQWNDLGKRLFEMNIEAVNQRYEEKNNTKVFFIYNQPECTKFEALKAMECLLYQCSEGNVIETPLYKELDLYVNLMQKNIIKEMPEYENAEWGD